MFTNIANERTTCPPWGLRGGLPGAVNDTVVRQPGGQPRPTSRSTPGCGWRRARTCQLPHRGRRRLGRGRPSGPPRTWREDVLDGFVSPQAARELYRVEVSADGVVDAERPSGCAPRPPPTSRPMSLVDELAERAHTVAGEPLPAAVRASARAHLTDALGGVLRRPRHPAPGRSGSAPARTTGARGPPPRPAVRRSSAGCTRTAGRWAPSTAASVLCPGCVVLPAVLGCPRHPLRAHLGGVPARVSRRIRGGGRRRGGGPRRPADPARLVADRADRAARRRPRPSPYCWGRAARPPPPRSRSPRNRPAAAWRVRRPTPTAATC